MVAKWKQLENTKDPDLILGEILGRKYKEYRNKWEKAANALEKTQNYPIHLDFELNFGCNLKCPQCILQVNPAEFNDEHPYSINKEKQKISLGKFEEIVDEGVKYGLSSVTLGVNNEPLMNRDLIKHIRYAHKSGIQDIIILTNGTLLTKELSGKLVGSGLTKLYFSVDAINRETYKKIRKGGDLKKVMENINYFLDLKKKQKRALPVTRVSFVKSKVNEAELDKFVKYWQPRVDFVSIQAFVTPAYGYSNYRKLKNMLQIENDDLKVLGSCPQPYQRLTIYHDGSVHPCCHWSGAMLNVGNIHSESVYSIWNSGKMQKIRERVNDKQNLPDECKICRKVVFSEA